jgi:hypothetical protein
MTQGRSYVEAIIEEDDGDFEEEEGGREETSYHSPFSLARSIVFGVP